MTETPEAQVSETQIAVHWREEELLYPPESFVRQANANDPAILERFAEDKYPDCFTEYADLLDWDERWHTVLDTSDAPFWKWFGGGKLNASYNCVDRHAAASPDKTAIIFVPELESDETLHISYGELLRQVNEFAALLRDFAGLSAGDRVTLHMPMVPEAAVTMLACARLGVDPLTGVRRLQRPGLRDPYRRLRQPGPDHDGRLLPGRHRSPTTRSRPTRRWPRRPGRARRSTRCSSGGGCPASTPRRPPWWTAGTSSSTSVLPAHSGATVAPVPMPAEAPLFLMYTSGTTGRPKGAQHSTGGYMSYVSGTSRNYLDIHPDDVYWCMADIGWITGHSYIVYGPLALGTTTVIYEGVPNYPDGGRPWRIAEKLGVNIFHTSPTAIRMLRKVGPEEPRKYNYRFKSMTTVGEPIEPEVWRWYYTEVGKGEAVITDTWWMTETGGFLGTTLPALQPMKPGSCGPGALGIFPVIYDEERNEIPPGSGKAGNICIRYPWPGIMQTIWGQPERFLEVYFRKYNVKPDSKDWHDWPFLCGDGALRSADGYIRILGRIDDVINVAGHRLGTKEIESAALTVPEVAEAAAVPVIDDIRGRMVELYVSLKPGIRSQRRDGRQGDRGDRDGDRQDRPAEERVDRAGHAQDPVRQDHAPGHRRGVQLHRRRRRDDARQRRGGRRHPAPGPGGQGRQGRRAP